VEQPTITTPALLRKVYDQAAKIAELELIRDALLERLNDYMAQEARGVAANVRNVTTDA
jgi:hypothetical protein